MAIRVVLADDHPVVRAGVRQELEAAELDVIGEAANGVAALRMARQLKPDVLILDIKMPGMDGLEVVQALRPKGAKGAKGAKIKTPALLMLSAHEDERYVMRLLSAGATGYVLKDEALDTIVMAVQAAVRGESWLSPKVVARVTRRALGRGSNQLQLTKRQLEVLKLLARGWGNQRIAANLFVREQTIKNHVSQIMAKLSVDSRVAAAIRAISLGVVTLEELDEWL